MAGYGGGRLSWRPHIEDAISFDLVCFKSVVGCIANQYLRGSWCWETFDGMRAATVSYFANTDETKGELVLSYALNGDPKETRIKLESLPMNFGGRRWWMICPSSLKRARKLYLYPGIDRFIHREAIHPRPTYAIQRTSGNNKVTQQRWAIRRKLGDNFDAFSDCLVKPKGMRQSTFAKYRIKDEKLAEKEMCMLAKIRERHDS